jgi:predicted GNAT family acetyltransferase
MDTLEIVQSTFENEEYKKFMRVCADEVELIFPHFSEEDAVFSEILMLKTEDEIIGVFIYQQKGDLLQIDVDFLVSKHRDQGIGQDFFNQKMDDFKKGGYRTIVALANNKIHRGYLESLGFKQALHPDRFQLQLR